MNIVIGNWKMNPVNEREAIDLLLALREETKNISGVESVIAPPFVYLSSLYHARGRASRPALGGQDVFYADSGSHTGEISPVQLKDLDAHHAIIGHSERRALGESDAQIARKTRATLESRMTAILCIGEHKRGEDDTFYDELERQLAGSLDGVSGKDFDRLVVAYEPIWAIGGDEAMQPTQINKTVAFLREALIRIAGEQDGARPRVIYGGSVDSTNIEAIMQEGGVDGVLPGRASRDPHEFRAILEAARNTERIDSPKN